MTNSRLKTAGVILLALTLTLFGGCSDDNPILSDQVTWYTNVGTAGMDYGNDIVATDDGGFVIAGYTDNNPAIVRDAFLAKVDGSGNVVWQGLYGGYSYAWANAVTAAHDGGYVAAGHILTLDDPPGDVYIFKVADDGSLLWEKRFGEGGYAIAVDIVATPDGGYVAAGETELSIDDNTNNIYLVKIDADGNTLWERKIGEHFDTDTHAFAQTLDGGFVIVDVGSVLLADGVHNTYVIRRTNSEGELLYEKSLTSEMAAGCNRILPTTDGGFVILGTARYYAEGTLDRYYDINLMKIDDAANLVWEKTIDVGDEDTPYYIAAMPDRGFVISGRTDDYSDHLPRFTHVVRTTDDGTVLWKRSFALEDRIYGDAVTACSDGGVAVTGRVYSPESGYDAFVMKVDANGELCQE